MALNFLRDDTAVKFESRGGELLRDPWAARNDYISLLLDPNRYQSFFAEHGVPSLDVIEEVLASCLLEMQHSALLMFTSCGWFFSDLAGIETIQVLRYAARVLDLQKELGFEVPRKQFLELLAQAKSNRADKGNGADIFLQFAEPAGALR